MCKPYPTDVVFVIDSSNSCSPEYFNITKNFIKSVTKEWEITVNNFQVAIISYTDNSYIELNFDNAMNKISFDAFVSQMNPRGGISEIHKGINHAVNILYNRNRVVASSQVKKYIIVLSDGLPSTPSMISTVSGHRIETMAVAVGEDVSHHFLSVITGGSEKIFPYNNDRLWHYMMDALIDQSCDICQRYEEGDVLFAVDTSNGWQNLDLATKVPTIINKILSGLKLGPMNKQIALLTFASSSYLRFDFNKYNNETERQNLQRQLSSFIKTTDTNTNITALINSANALLFDSETGARVSAKKLLVVFSNYQKDVTIEESKLIETLKEKVEIFVVGLDNSDEQFQVMLDIASTSFHIGIDGDMLVNSIDTYIASLLEQINTVYCELR
ncbi:cartilage matrix protein-like [Mytilus trossulus]|uniref:cartilage matrix protein-like n=1 Tax=Mytilus trossulus TaxID=6551 RepID=UPI0030073B0C